jgi:hypothetical protein
VYAVKLWIYRNAGFGDAFFLYQLIVSEKGLWDEIQPKIFWQNPFPQANKAPIK